MQETSKDSLWKSDEIPDLPFGTYWVLCIKKGYKTGIKKVKVPPGEAGFVLTPNLE